MADIDFLTLAGIILMSAAHLWSSRITLLDGIKKQGWVSFSAGASAAYVFAHVFPEIGVFQQQILENTGGHGQSVTFFNQPLYLAALGGLCLLFLLDSIDNKYSGDGSPNLIRKHNHFMKFFWTRAVLYGLYNLMIGYIVIQRHGEGLVNIMLIVVALMLHFTVINIRFIERYKEFYQKYVRWLAMTGLFLGWILGVAVELPAAIVATSFAIIGGMITYVAFKSELAETENKAPYYFLAGVAVYSLIILAIPFFGISIE